MTQITPVGNNPFSMFKMPESKPASAPVATNVASAPQKVDSVEITNTAQDKKDTIEIAGKKINTKAALAAGGVAVAVVAGLIYAIKTHKLPFFKGKLKNEAAELAQQGARQAHEIAQSATRTAIETLEPVAAQAQKAASDAGDVVEVLEPLVSQAQKAAADAGNVASGIIEPAAAQAQKAAGQVTQTIAEDIVQPVATKKSNNLGFALAAFSVGLIARGFREFMPSKDSKIESLKNSVLENESYIKDIEIPYIYQEAQEYYDNYQQDIINAIDFLENKVESLQATYNLAIGKYENLDSGSYSEYWEDSDTKKLTVTRRKNGSVKLEEFNQEGKGSQVTYYTKTGRPLSVEYRKGGKPSLKLRFKLSKETGEPYLSQMFVYPKGSKKASMIAFDENLNPEFYLARNKEGDLMKAFDIDSTTLDLKTVILPDEHGKDWLKRYTYGSDGILQSALIMPSNDLPARKYNFTDSVPESLDLFENIDDEPVLHVPFSEDAQLEFIEK